MRHFKDFFLTRRNIYKVFRDIPLLNQSLHIKEECPSQISRWSILILSVIFFGFMIGAVFVPIQENVIASGEVISTGVMRPIQHLEGGVVQEIKVQEGSLVKEDQVLLVLDEKKKLSELNQMLIREIALKIKAERLRAFGLGQKADFGIFTETHKDLVADQQAINNMHIQNQKDQQEIVKKQQEQNKDLLVVQAKRAEDLRVQLNIVEKQRDVTEQLFKKHLKTGTEYRNSAEKAVLVQKELDHTLSQMQQTHQAIADSENKILDFQVGLRKEALEEMEHVTRELTQLKTVIEKQKDNIIHLTIKAPVSGIIHNLKDNIVKKTIQPGEEILQIMPENALEVEARVKPKDINRLQVGQAVTLRVSDYEDVRLEPILGKVHFISASSFLDEHQKPYQKVFITLNKFHMGKKPEFNRLAVGMTVKINIHTGQKSLLKYLLNPSS